MYMYLSDIIQLAKEDPLLERVIRKVDHDYMNENMHRPDVYQTYCHTVLVLYAQESAKRYIKSALEQSKEFMRK